MRRPPAFPAEQKVQIVLSILACEITAADAARQFKVSEQSIGTWKPLFLEGGRAGLDSRAAGAPSREAELEPEVKLRGWKKSAERLALSRTLRHLMPVACREPAGKATASS